MVPGNSDGIPRVPPYSGLRPYAVVASVRGLHPLRRAVPDASIGLPAYITSDPITPAHASRHRRFGLFPVRSPLLGESFLLSSPAATKMFQFAAFASRSQRDAGIAPGGLPHSDIRGSTGICPSPRLFAACHVLLRLREPRHPPCALVSFRMPYTATAACHDGYIRLTTLQRLIHYGRLMSRLCRLKLSARDARLLDSFVSRLLAACLRTPASIMSSCSSLVVLGRVELPTSTLSV